MKIQPVISSAPVYRASPPANAPEAAALRDEVELSGDRVLADQAPVALKTALAAAGQPGVGGALAQALERLDDKGFGVRRRAGMLGVRFWKAADPERAARAVTEDERPLELSRDEKTWVLESPEQVLTFDAFYGAQDTARLDRPALASALKALEEDGVEFPGGAYGQYLALAGQDGEQFLSQAFFRGLSSSQDLSQPSAADFLAARAGGGYEFPALESYESYRRGERDKVVELQRDGLTVASFPLSALDDPAALTLKVAAHEAALAAFRERVGEDAPAYWKVYRPNEHLQQDVKALESLHQVGAGAVPQLFSKVVEEPGTAPLAAELLQALGGEGLAVEAFETMKELESPRARQSFVELCARQGFHATRELKDRLPLQPGLLALAGDDEDLYLRLAQSGTRHLDELGRVPGVSAEGWSSERESGLGTVWTVSEARFGQPSTLTSTPIDLRGCERPTVKMDFSASLGNKKDCFLEAAGPDGTWCHVASIPSSGGWKSQEWDLSAFAGRNVRLRLRYQAERDYYTSAQGPRPSELQIANLRVESETGATLFRADEDPPLEQLLVHPDLEALLASSRRLGSRAAGLEAWDKGPPFQDLVDHLGLPLAQTLWPAYDGNLERAQAAVDLGARLAADPGERVSLSLALMKTPLKAEELGRVHRLVEASRDVWKREEWRPTSMEAYLGDGYYADSRYGTPTMTSPAFDLSGLVEPELRFVADAKLGYRGELKVETSADGQEWKSLKTFQGSFGATDVRLPLEPGTTRVRLTMVAHYDGYSSTSTSVRVRGLSVVGTGPHGPRVALRGDTGDLDGEALVKTLAGGRGALATLEALSARTGNLQAALGLVGKLGAGESADALGHLACEVGLPAAASVWPVEDVGPVLASYRTACAINREREIRDQLELFRALCALKLSAAGEQRLGALCDKARLGWSQVSGWHSGTAGAEPILKAVGDNYQERLLETPTLALDAGEAHLAFALEGSLSYQDSFEVQASRDGKAWQPLKTFESSVDWSRHEVDLSDFKDGPVKLRFALRQRRDHYSSSRKAEVSLGQVAVVAGERTLFSGQTETPEPQQLAELVSGTLESHRIRALEGLAEQVGSLGAAVELWPLVEPLVGKPELEDRCRDLGRLVGRLGVPSVKAAWDSLEELGVEGLAAQWKAAGELAEGELAEQTRLFPAFLRYRPDESERNQLEELARRAHPNCTGWNSSQGTWSARADKYNPPALTTAELPEGARRVAFLARTALNYDESLTVEARTGDDHWEELAKLTATTDWTRHELELPAGTRQVRFAMHNQRDSYSRRTDGEASLADISVSGDEGILLRANADGLDRDRLLRQALDGNREQNLSHLESLAAALGSTPDASELFAEVGPGHEQAFGGLVQSVGWKAAREIWPAVLKEPSRAERASELLHLAEKLAPAQGYSQHVELLGRLLPADLSAEECATLVALAERGAANLGDGRSGSSWQLSNSSWSNYATRPVDLEGAQSPTLTLTVAPRLGWQETFHLEAVDAQGQTRQLGTVEGSEPRRLSFDLSDLEGPVHFAFRFTDRGSHRRQGTAAITDLVVRDGQRVLLRGESEPVDPAELVQTALAGRERLGELAELAQQAGSTQAALSLWPLVKQDGDAEALGRLAAASSAEAAASLWPDGADAETLSALTTYLTPEMAVKTCRLLPPGAPVVDLEALHSVARGLWQGEPELSDKMFLWLAQETLAGAPPDRLAANLEAFGAAFPREVSWKALERLAERRAAGALSAMTLDDCLAELSKGLVLGVDPVAAADGITPPVDAGLIDDLDQAVVTVGDVTLEREQW